MVVPKIAICPICGKKTYLRVEDGGYLKEYPIRFHCVNCRALIKGVYIMDSSSGPKGLQLFNASIEECNVDSSSHRILNADYVIDISGELPCQKVRAFDGNIIASSPFLEATGQVDMLERKERLRSFVKNMDEWKQWRSIAFQLLDEGSIDFVSAALRNKMGAYSYQCDHYLKALHCLQEVVHEETNYLFFSPTLEATVQNLVCELSGINRQALHDFVLQLGGVQVLVSYYKKMVDVVSSFMDIYPNILPAETYLRYTNKPGPHIGIATCSFSDIKTFYQDAYESLLTLAIIPVGLDNILIRSNHLTFNSTDYSKLFKKWQYVGLNDDYCRYIALDNGKKLEKLNNTEPMQRLLDISANKDLRNGIGHNNLKYDGATQEVSAYDRKNPSNVLFKKYLIDIAVDCIGMVRSAVTMSEMLLFILRQELHNEGIHSLIPPNFYIDAEPNNKCPCGSNRKYKKCCRNEVDILLRNKQ